MAYADDPEGYRRKLEAKLAPERIRATLSFAGLYLLTHGLITNAVVEQTKGFFGKVDDTWIPLSGEQQFKKDVLARQKKPFKACLLWLVDTGAITGVQADRLDAIYEHRNDLAHELMKYIVEPDVEPDVGLFLDALAILADIQRFWTQVDKDLGTFEEYGDIDLDEVTPLSLAILSKCIDAYAGGLPDSTDGPAPR
jgi:hypothetical protein